MPIPTQTTQPVYFGILFKMNYLCVSFKQSTFWLKKKQDFEGGVGVEDFLIY